MSAHDYYSGRVAPIAEFKAIDPDQLYYVRVVSSDGDEAWAAHNGYFPNGTRAARWVDSQSEADLFERRDALAIRGRVEFGDVELIPA